MASSAQGVGGGGGSNNDNDHNDLSCVYRPVDQGASAEQVRAILAGGPSAGRGRNEWLERVVNHKNAANGETPLQAAHRRRDGPLVGALLEHGADARALGRFANALAICIAYGQVDSLRVLLSSGKHSADERLAYSGAGTIEGASYRGFSCCPVHLCVVPPRLSSGNDPPPPQLECLDVLAREFGADVNKTDEPYLRTPLQWLALAHASHERRAFDALMALGADLNVPNTWGKTFIFYVREPDRLQQVLARGASPNFIAPDGNTPLINACLQQNEAIVSALLPLTSTETRRSVLASSGYSALDWLLVHLGSTPKTWHGRAIEELLSSRVPVQPSKAARALPIAARLGARLAAEAAVEARRNDPPTWQGHEAMVGLAFDFRT